MTKFSKKEIIKNEAGITLTALILTVIVMTILVGASIATISGKEGIINETRTAANSADSKTIIDEVRITVSKMAIQWDGNGTVKNYVISKIQGFGAEGYKTEAGAQITVEDGKIVYTFEGKAYTFIITDDGKVEYDSQS